MKEEIHEKLKKTGIFVPGITATSEVRQTGKQNKMMEISAYKENQKEKMKANKHLISEILPNPKHENDISGFYVKYESSDSKSEEVSEESINDETIENRLKEMADEKKLKEKVEFEEDLDEISLEIDDPRTFTLGRDDNRLEQINQGLSYVDTREMKQGMPHMVNLGPENWKTKTFNQNENESELSASKNSQDLIRKKHWSDAESFSADSEEGKE